MFFTFNGTAANSLALASLCQSYHSVICHEFAHVETDECGGAGVLLQRHQAAAGRGRNGKIDPATVERDRHAAAPTFTIPSRAC